MSEEEPAWRRKLREALDERFISSGDEIFDLVLPHAQAAEERGRQRALKEHANGLKADWSRYRGSVLQEAWAALRDAEGGPLIHAMHVVNSLLESP